MAQVAKSNQYVTDELGIRRLVVAGQPVPPGISTDGIELVEADIRAGAAPVIDAEGNKPSGTAADPQAGISTDASEGLRQAARGKGKSAAKRGGDE